MRISGTGLCVDDQRKALQFYTEVLGFQKKDDIPVGNDMFWLTVVSPEDPDGPQVSLEPEGHPAVKPFKEALFEDGIPFTSFAVPSCQHEYDRLTALGVRFTQPPVDHGPVITAVLDDTCGNLIQISEEKPKS